MTNREFRRRLTEKRLEAIRADVIAENTAPLVEKRKEPATERQFKGRPEESLVIPPEDRPQPRLQRHVLRAAGGSLHRVPVKAAHRELTKTKNGPWWVPPGHHGPARLRNPVLVRREMESGRVLLAYSAICGGPIWGETAQRSAVAAGGTGGG